MMVPDPRPTAGMANEGIRGWGVRGERAELWNTVAVTVHLVDTSSTILFRMSASSLKRAEYSQLRRQEGIHLLA